MISKQLYRDGMARFAAAVHIVTTDGPAGSAGFTASAACSVTDDPPTLLVCLNRASELHGIFQGNGVFCLNTLAAGQQELSELFSRRGGLSMRERFELPVWEKLATGSPVLRDALVSFDCRIAGVREEGTHWVIFGAVQDVKTLSRIADRASGRESALLYLNRSYRELPLQTKEND
jgi:flavin reductase (DIM6/NTAB) family NADH-FMN oxidoreductase RutF